MATMEARIEKAIKIIHGYEGLGGARDDGRFYPYQGSADKPGVITIGRGHVISAADKASGRFSKGLTLAEVDELFLHDLMAPRGKVPSRVESVEIALGKWTDDQFAGALSMYYNIEQPWAVGMTPYRNHRNGDYKAAAKAFLMYILDGNKRRCLGLYRRRMTEALCYLTGEVMIGKSPDAEAKLQSRLLKEISFTRPTGLK